MDCFEARENLSAYIDGELDPDVSIKLKRHLDICVECKREHDELSEVAELLRVIPETPLPEGFDARLRAAVRAEKVKRISNSKKMWKTLSGIAAVFVIGFFSVTMYNQTDVAEPMGGGGFGERNALAVEAVEAVEAVDEAGAEDAVEDAAIDAGAGNADRKSAEAVDTELFNEPESEADVSADVPVMESNRQGIRDKTEADYYSELLEEMLIGLDYRIVDFYMDSGDIWKFEVVINTVNEHNEPYQENYIYIGQDGTLWREESSSSTETAY